MIMKKLMIATAIFMGFGLVASAQKTAPAATTKTTTKMKVVKTTAPAKTAVVKPMTAPKPAVAKVAPAVKPTTAVKAAAAKPVATTGTHLKADGTPDKRFKAKPASSGPLKKDGTPDMRYKANKTVKKG